MEITLASPLCSNPQLMIFSSTPKPRRTMPHVLASKSMASSFNQKPVNNQEMKSQRKKKMNESPTIAEIERVIGIKTDDLSSSSSSSSSSSLLQMLATESAAEKKLRETAEWIVEKTEDRALVSKRCRTCRGQGAIECPGCKGTGKNKKNGNIFERWKCFECQGFGMKSCPNCGKGGLTPEQRGER